MKATVRDQFLKFFHKQPGIDSAHTDEGFVDGLVSAYCNRSPGVVTWERERNKGTTRTIYEFAQFVDEPVLVITETPEAFRGMPCSSGTRCGDDGRGVFYVKRWTESIRGLNPRPVFALIDCPFNDRVHNSPVMKAKAAKWLSSFPYPAFFAGRILEPERPTPLSLLNDVCDALGLPEDVSSVTISLTLDEATVEAESSVPDGHKFVSQLSRFKLVPIEPEP